MSLENTDTVFFEFWRYLLILRKFEFFKISIFEYNNITNRLKNTAQTFGCYWITGKLVSSIATCEIRACYEESFRVVISNSDWNPVGAPDHCVNIFHKAVLSTLTHKFWIQSKVLIKWKILRQTVALEGDQRVAVRYILPSTIRTTELSAACTGGENTVRATEWP